MRNVAATERILQAGAPLSSPDGNANYESFSTAQEIETTSVSADYVVFRLRNGRQLLRTPAASTTPQDGLAVFTRAGAPTEYRAAATDLPTVDVQRFRRSGATDGGPWRMAPSPPRTRPGTCSIAANPRPGSAFRPAGCGGSAGFQSLPQRLERPEDLFPPGSPNDADIKQTGLGDCYLQAVLIEIALRDPAHLRAIMTPHGDVVSVRLHHQATAQAAFTPEEVTVQASLPTSATGAALYNAGAIWARLMQKAFAVFAERHGQYGTAYAPYQAAQPGYEGIASGVEHKLYEVFYGPRVSSHSRTETGYDADRADLGASLGAINRLLTFAAPSADRTTFLTAGAHIPQHVGRALAHANSLNLNEDQDTMLAFRRALEAARTALQTAPAEGAAVLPSVQTVKRLAAPMATLLEQYPGEASTKLRELCLDLAQIGTDASAGRRFIYSSHAYAIVGVSIRMRGEAVTPAALTQEQLAQVDFATSRVTLRNPHRGNVPTGTEPDADGRFELSLAQFTRHFSEIDEGVVERR